MQHFEHELSTLKERLLVMASYAENAVNRAVEAWRNRDDALAQKVKDEDTILDRLEMELDELAIGLLAQAPLASDLRLITVAMKITQNLERVGDEATKITKRTRDLNQEPPLKIATAIPQLAERAVGMLRSALDAFVSGNTAVARELIARDKEVDALNKQILAELEAAMLASPDNIKRCLSLMVVSRSLERVADHAKNVAEEVVYLREALDIRHAQQQAAAGK
jgi:phosphate transport system protein